MTTYKTFKLLTTMKFYLPYILFIFLIIFIATFGIAAIIANDIYVAGLFTSLTAITSFVAAMLFFKIDEDGNEK